MKENKKKRLLLEDIPIEKEEMDEFTHNVFVEVLLELIKDINGPCNIGLFGKWGIGKTSIVKMLSSKVKNKEKIKYIYFDAWKYSDESLRTQILLEIDEKLDNPVGKEKIIDILYNIKEEEEVKRSDIRNFFLKSRIFWTSLIVMIVTVLIIHYIFPNKEIIVFVAASIIVPFLAQLIATVQSASISVSRRTILPGKEWPGIFENIFKEIIEKAKYEKIVIVIDNLDRCQSRTVIKMLALLKTFMDIKKCIYIIPCDGEALLSHINTLDSSMGYFKESGQEFLKKIFQVTIKIPPFLGESLEEYAQKLRSQMRFSFDDNVQDVIVSAYAETPRQIIHIFNKLTTFYLLAREKEKEKIIKEGTITNNLPFLAKILVIEDEWRDFYNDLSCNPFLLEEVENYFRGKPLNKENEKRIMKHFNDNPKLRDFLNATRVVRADNIEPFLLLSQEAYEYAIPELERFRLYLYRSNVNQIRNTLNQLSDSGKIHHAKEILKIAKKAIQGGRFSLGFNCLNVLSHVCSILPEDFRFEAAREFGHCLDREGIREFLTSFDYGKLFGILPHMNEVNKDDVLTILAGTIFSEKEVDTVLVQEFIEHSDIVGDETKEKLNDVIIGMLDSKNPEAAEDVISLISKNGNAKKNLLQQGLLRKIIEKIAVNESGQQEGINLYLQIDEVADQGTKEEFISKELGFLAESVPDKTAKVKQVLNALGKLKLDKISPDLAGKLYSQLKKETRQLPRNQRTDYFRFMMRNLDTFTDSNKSNFLKSDIKEILVSGEPSEVDSIMGMALESGVDILYDENILNTLFQRIPSALFQSNILEYLIRYAPSEKQEVVKNKLVDILHGEDSSKISHALKAIDNQFEYLQKTISDEIVKVCINKAAKWENHNQKDAALTPVSKSFSKLPNDKQESIIDCIISFLKTPATRNIGKKHYELIRNHLKKRQKERLASELLQGLITIPDEELNGGTKLLIEVLFELEPIMKVNETESLIENILRMVKDSLKSEQIEAGLLYLERFEEFYGLEDRVIDQVSKVMRTEDGQISSVANRILTSLREKGKMKTKRTVGLSRITGGHDEPADRASNI